MGSKIKLVQLQKNKDSIVKLIVALDLTVDFSGKGSKGTTCKDYSDNVAKLEQNLEVDLKDDSIQALAQKLVAQSKTGVESCSDDEKEALKVSRGMCEVAQEKIVDEIKVEQEKLQIKTGTTVSVEQIGVATLSPDGSVVANVDDDVEDAESDKIKEEITIEFITSKTIEDVLTKVSTALTKIETRSENSMHSCTKASGFANKFKILLKTALKNLKLQELGVFLVKFGIEGVAECSSKE